MAKSYKTQQFLKFPKELNIAFMNSILQALSEQKSDLHFQIKEEGNDKNLVNNLEALGKRISLLAL